MSLNYQEVNRRQRSNQGRNVELKRVGRRASCADIGQGDHQGWLLYKTRSHSIFLSSSTWVKRWCIIKHKGFYVFKDSEIDSKAETIISMKAFKVCEAPFVKSKPFAFKIFNSGTEFLFASDSELDMKRWIHDAESASVNVHEHLEDINDYHEFESDDSEDDSDDEDDLRVITRNIKDSSVTLDGSDKSRRRRTAISGDWRSTVNDEDLQRYMELSTKLKSLQRTLKKRERSLRRLRGKASSKTHSSRCRHGASQGQQQDTLKPMHTMTTVQDKANSKMRSSQCRHGARQGQQQDTLKPMHTMTKVQDKANSKIHSSRCIR